MEKIYARPSTMIEGAKVGFCPGCMHSTVHKLVAEVIDELGIANNVVTIWGIGCCGLGSLYTTQDGFEATHGRACAMASAYKRCNPDEIVYTYQGDGDLASIGIAETIYAANRGENFTVIFINNSTYGMTGGQMAPTTLVGQKTTTSPYGRKEEWSGAPIKVCEMLSQIPGTYYAERVALDTTANILKAKKAITKAFKYQMEGHGLSIVEVLSTCPTNWGMSPVEALKWLEDNMIPYYPLGVYKDKGAE